MRRLNLDGQLDLYKAFDDAARTANLENLDGKPESQESKLAPLSSAELAAKYCRPIIERIKAAENAEKNKQTGFNPENFNKYGNDRTDSAAWEYYRDRSK